jgi:menaquinol-cytochrome c reductase iron-sulfur subunit
MPGKATPLAKRAFGIDVRIRLHSLTSTGAASEGRVTEARKGEDEEEDRRGVLKLLVNASGAAFACALAAPAVVFATAPAKSLGASQGRWVKTVRLDSLPENEPRKVAIVADQRDAWTLTKGVELGAVWLVKNGDKVLALSTTCPHLGCSVNIAPDGFGCPCHASTFDRGGHRTGGPSPRDMDPIETRVEDGFVLVDFRKYRVSIPERVAVG